MYNSNINNTLTIFKREFFSYFNSPVFYVIIVIFLLAAQGFAFLFGSFLDSDNAALNNAFFSWHPWIYMVLAPAVGMKLWSEEHRLGTIELLMTMPISPWQAILGKFMAAGAVWLISLMMTMPIVITVFYLGSPDVGPIMSGYFASYLFALGCLSITCAVSAYTRSQVVCFIVSVAICLVLCLIGYTPIVEWCLGFLPSQVEWLVRGISYLSFMDHFQDMTKGVLIFRDVLYFLSVIVVSLLITYQGLDSKRI
jgi:ABC-2 type transport system permease protein